MYCLDSDIIIDFLGGKRDAATLLNLPAGQMCTTVLNMQEVLLGFTPESEGERRAAAFFQRMQILPYTDKTVQNVLAIKRTLQKSGSSTGAIDEIIAGICITNETTLITRNAKHFKKIKGLKTMFL